MISKFSSSFSRKYRTIWICFSSSYSAMPEVLKQLNYLIQACNISVVLKLNGFGSWILPASILSFVDLWVWLSTAESLFKSSLSFYSDPTWHHIVFRSNLSFPNVLNAIQATVHMVIIKIYYKSKQKLYRSSLWTLLAMATNNSINLRCGLEGIHTRILLSKRKAKVAAAMVLPQLLILLVHKFFFKFSTKGWKGFRYLLHQVQLLFS